MWASLAFAAQAFVVVGRVSTAMFGIAHMARSPKNPVGLDSAGLAMKDGVGCQAIFKTLIEDDVGLRRVDHGQASPMRPLGAALLSVRQGVVDLRRCIWACKIWQPTPP